MPPKPTAITLRAPAKINLVLAVLSKLPDGYHQISTIFQTISLCDELTLTRRPSGITITCDDPTVPSDERNLCHRAAALLLPRLPDTEPQRGVEITLRKRIPAQAGLGGGSSDAAATLLGLNRLWGLKLRRQELRDLAAEIGADVPFFLQGGMAMGAERGDQIVPIGPGPELPLVIARPAEGVSTAWAYSRCRPSGDTGAAITFMSMIARLSPATVARVLHNDLEQAVFPERPDIADLKSRLVQAGALGALMSGSGAAVFGIFATHKAAQEAAASLSNNGWWACAARSVSDGVAFTK